MTALSTDTRSIGQVLYETMYPTSVQWLKFPQTERDAFERAAEVLFKRGYDARGKEEKTLTPTAKHWRQEAKTWRGRAESDRKQYRGTLKEMVEAFAQFRPPLGVAQLRALAKAEAVLK